MGLSEMNDMVLSKAFVHRQFRLFELKRQDKPREIIISNEKTMIWEAYLHLYLRFGPATKFVIKLAEFVYFNELFVKEVLSEFKTDFFIDALGELRYEFDEVENFEDSSTDKIFHQIMSIRDSENPDENIMKYFYEALKNSDNLAIIESAREILMIVKSEIEYQIFWRKLGMK